MIKLLKQSIKFKILIPFSLLSLATLSVMSIVAYAAARNQLKIGVFEKLTVVANLKKYQLQHWMDSQAEDVFILANDLPRIKVDAEKLTDGHFFFDTIAAYLLNRRGSYVKASNS